uniref:Tc1-like transposase DDE domain-containing protein n=1 Tax=Plectus sambesii TaxID=2011161 RepID=A0A914UP31_9BILA
MRNKYATISDVDRQRIVGASLSGQNASMIANVMGRVEAQQRGGVKAHKLTEDQKTTIRNWVNNDSSITLPRLKEKCLATFGVAVSSSTIGRILEAFSYTIKRVHLQPVRRNDAAAIEARWQYAQTFLELFAQRRDGSKTWEVAARDMGHAGCVRTAVKEHFHLLRHEHPASTPILGNEKSHQQGVFCTFLEELFLMLAERGVTNAVLVMDNVPFHKGEQVCALVESHGHRVLYLPPYSLFFNPIEYMFSKWKEYVPRERPENEPRLLDLINN